jgi:hypothetical protein
MGLLLQSANLGGDFVMNKSTARVFFRHLRRFLEYLGSGGDNGPLDTRRARNAIIAVFAGAVRAMACRFHAKTDERRNFFLCVHFASPSPNNLPASFIAAFHRAASSFGSRHPFW